eukprot:m.139877 g.139877  ORF g.139877 m.139877 type:complete len:181 (-) comp17071_c0_seq4:739-1281(-)
MYVPLPSVRSKAPCCCLTKPAPLSAKGYASVPEGEGEGCRDIDECLDPELPHECAPDEYCDNLPGTVQCSACDPSCKGCRGSGPERCHACANGFVPEPQDTARLRCIDHDECADFPCEPGFSCTNSVGSYACACNEPNIKGEDGQCVEPDDVTAAAADTFVGPFSPPDEDDGTGREIGQE